MILQNEDFVGSVKLSSTNTGHREQDNVTFSSSRDFRPAGLGLWIYADEKPSRAVITTDIARSIPVYYTYVDNKLHVDTRPDQLLQYVSGEFSPSLTDEYRLAGYVSGRNTRHPDIKQLLPGEKLVYDGDDLRIEQWYDLRFSDQHSRKTIHQAQESFEPAIDALVEYASGRKIIVLLSGGYDSRLILSELVKRGYSDLLALSYGTAGSSEREVARRVAGELGIDFYPIDYSKEAWYDWWESDHRKHLYDICGSIGCIPHIEFGPAIHKLTRSSSIASNAVIVPGHTGDYISGSHTPDQPIRDSFESTQDTVEYLVERHFKYGSSKKPSNNIHDRIEDQLSIDSAAKSTTDYCSAVEWWEWKNRQAKLVIQSLRTIEAGGFDWYIPLWHPSFVQFWETVPYDQRYDKSLYEQFAEQVYVDAGGSKSAADRTDRSNVKNHAKSLARETALGQLVRPAYQDVKQRFRRQWEDKNWHSLVSDEDFRSVSGDRSINAYVSRGRIGEINFGT